MNYSFPFDELLVPFWWITRSLLMNYSFPFDELLVPFLMNYSFPFWWITHSLLMNYSFPFDELLIPFWWITHSLLMNYSFPFDELLVPFWWITRSLLMNYSFPYDEYSFPYTVTRCIYYLPQDRRVGSPHYQSGYHGDIPSCWSPLVVYTQVVFCMDRPGGRCTPQLLCDIVEMLWGSTHAQQTHPMEIKWTMAVCS